MKQEQGFAVAVEKRALQFYLVHSRAFWHSRADLCCVLRFLLSGKVKLMF